MHALQQLGYKKGQTGITRFELGENPFEIKVDKYTEYKSVRHVNKSQGPVKMANNIHNLLKNEKSKESNELKKIIRKISTIDTSYISMQPGSGTQYRQLHNSKYRISQADAVFTTFSNNQMGEQLARTTAMGSPVAGNMNFSMTPNMKQTSKYPQLLPSIQRPNDENAFFPNSRNFTIMKVLKQSQEKKKQQTQQQVENIKKEQINFFISQTRLSAPDIDNIIVLPRRAGSQISSYERKPDIFTGDVSLVSSLEDQKFGSPFVQQKKYQYNTEQKRPFLDDIMIKTQAMKSPPAVNILDQLNQTGTSLPYINLRAVKPLVYKKQQKEVKKKDNTFIYSRPNELQSVAVPQRIPVIPVESIKFSRMSQHEESAKKSTENQVTLGDTTINKTPTQTIIQSEIQPKTMPTEIELPTEIDSTPEVKIENPSSPDEIEEEQDESEDESKEEIVKPRRDILKEIITKKDSSNSGFHKAHMSFYTHVRKMKKANTLGLVSEGSAIDDGGSINCDLDCVLVEEPKVKAKLRGRKIKQPVRSYSSAFDVTKSDNGSLHKKIAERQKSPRGMQRFRDTTGLELIRENSTLSHKSMPESPTKKIIVEDQDSSEPKMFRISQIHSIKGSDSEVMCENSDDEQV